MEPKTRLIQLCALEMQRRGIYESNIYRDRFREEMKQINIQGEHDYFLELYDTRAKYVNNQNNMLIPWLLSICDDYDINKEAKFVYGEFPDIDVDFHPQIRDWLKDVWAPETFGRDKVCSIGNYATFGIKSALIDMARVHGQDHHEILKLTTQLEDRDEDNKPVTWEKALEQNPLLKEYCEKHPDIAKATQKMLNRSRGRGKHAGGLIISSVPIDSIVPLAMDKQGNPVSQWTEGLHAQDLGVVGLIKYDLLVVTNLVQIAIATQMVKDRRKLETICALPGQEDWSDVDKFLDDPDSINMADKAMLKCIFQFDSPGIRDLVRKGGTSMFDDIAAYSALFRPGPLSSGMAAAYVNRKRGKELYKLHPLLEPILGKTYGVMVYQEQVMKVLNVVGSIPLAHCEIVRKAISKKKVKTFQKYKDQFITNGKKNLGYSEAQLEEFWSQIEAFAGYGFNKAHAVSYAYISNILLHLKTHYPLEFFAAILSCESDENKIKEYRLEAEKCGVTINPLDINKSGVSFQIVGDEIYFGFSHVKGIGEEVAKRIVAGQPYNGFVDFIARFGTDASVMKPLIGLGLFNEADRISLWCFCEYYKEQTKKRADRDKRALNTLAKKAKELEDLYNTWDFNDPLNNPSTDFNKAVNKIKNAYRKSKGTWEKKKLEDQPICFDDFLAVMAVPYEVTTTVVTDEEGNERHIVKKVGFNAEDWIVDELREIYQDDIAAAQNKFYGFRWDRMINESPDYTGRTFENLDLMAETQDVFVGGVEVQVIAKPYQTISKKKTVYYNVKLEDGNGRQELVTVWKDEYERFKDELCYWESDARQGNLLRMKIQRPQGDFKKYTFQSWSRQNKHMTPKTKEEDGRMVVMKRP